MAVQERKAELPRDLPNLQLREVLPLLLLLQDECLHVSVLGHLHGDVETLPLLQRRLKAVLGRQRLLLIRLASILKIPAFFVSCASALQLFDLRMVNLTVDERIVELDYVRMLYPLHNFDLIRQLAILLQRDILFYSHFLEGDDAMQRFLSAPFLGVLLVRFVDNARSAFAENGL